jgi:hypothetical protein
MQLVRFRPIMIPAQTTGMMTRGQVLQLNCIIRLAMSRDERQLRIAFRR